MDCQAICPGPWSSIGLHSPPRRAIRFLLQNGSYQWDTSIVPGPGSGEQFFATSHRSLFYKWEPRIKHLSYLVKELLTIQMVPALIVPRLFGSSLFRFRIIHRVLLRQIIIVLVIVYTRRGSSGSRVGSLMT